MTKHVSWSWGRNLEWLSTWPEVEDVIWKMTEHVTWSAYVTERVRFGKRLWARKSEASFECQVRNKNKNKQKSQRSGEFLKCDLFNFSTVRLWSMRSNIAGEIGGHLGLFLGCSVVTAIEFIGFLISLCRHHRQRQQHNKRTNWSTNQRLRIWHIYCF